MVTKKIVITNRNGIHLRPAAILCEEALKYESLITFRVRDTIANAKSSLSVLAAGVKAYDELEFICEGIDEENALEQIIKLVENGLGE